MRWEVFKQDAPGKPHQSVGSVHGADAEHALLNARHVFGRRPAAVSVWVVAAAAIYSRTAEQLAEEEEEGLPPEGERTLFHVFAKATSKRSMTFVDHVADVEAAGPAHALTLAAAEHGDGVLAWWVVPASAVSRVGPDEAASWFDPAKDKTYKQQSAYGMVGAARDRTAPR